ncbi:MAG TPA: glycosyltransferase family 2 protein [Terriglobales bacterium]|nr:glycosyltransferase family 2 protein [Terriglobales bacterium]
MPEETVQTASMPRGGESPPPESLISVVIPSLRRPDLVEQCLASLARQTLPTQQFEVLVVENEAGPGAKPPAFLPKNARWLPLSENLGTTGSINRALEQSRSDYVMLLNNDVQLETRCLQALLDTLQADAGLGFATAKLLNARRPGVLDGAGDALLCGGGAYRLGHDNPDCGQFDRAAPVLAGCGAATLFRRAALEKAGRLDEHFFAYLDDVDLGLRVHLAGYRGVYTPEAVAGHLGSATLGDVFHPRIAELLTRNQLFLLMKDYPAGALWRLLGRITVFQLFWLALVVRRGRLGSYLRGVAGALLGVPKMLAKRRRLVRSRAVSSTQFLDLLRASERQIFAWQKALPAEARSALLTAYFRWFKPRGTVNP